MKKNPINYFKGVVREAKRVRWPKKEQFLPAISIVLCITIFAAIVLSLEDLAGQSLVEQLRKAFEAING